MNKKNKKRTKIPKMMNGEPWEMEHGKPQHIYCCDCDLAHLFIPFIEGKKVTLYFYRDDFATRLEREREGIQIRRVKNAKKRKTHGKRSQSKS